MPDVSPAEMANDAWRDLAEAERRRLARLLQSSVVGPLGTLLAQAHAYEQALGAHPQARQALAVLGSLARQALQQARDLEETLRPAVLDALGIEPALDALAGQVRRMHRLEVAIAVPRMRARAPRPIELAPFRLAQDALDRAAEPARATHAWIRLEQHAERLVLTVSDDGAAEAGREALQGACGWLARLGGAAELGIGPHGGLQVVASIAVAPLPALTPRELAVLGLLAQGRSNKAIAAALDISPRTVNFHLDNLYSKLGVASRTEALLAALRLGQLRAEEPG